MPRLPVDLTDVRAFLRLPDFKPYLEFFGGRVVQKPAKDLPRSVILGGLTDSLEAFARPRGLGRAFLSLRIVCGGSALIPEVSFFATGRVPSYERGDEVSEVTNAPDIAVEFLAPGQWSAEPRRKLRHLIGHGGNLGWVIDVRRERIEVLRPGQRREILEVGDILHGEEALPGFSLLVEEIFGWVDED